MLLVIARNPDVRLRDIASALDITERAAQRIVSELDEAGYLTRERRGRRNAYEVHADRPMRSPQARETEVGEILDVLLRNQGPAGGSG